MRIFLTSDSDHGREVMREILHELGHSVEDPATSGAGALLASQDLIADAVIAVLWAARSTKQRNAAVLVEIGIAIGRDLPVLLVTKPTAMLPALVGVPRLTAENNLDGLLGVQVDLFLQGLEKAPKKSWSRSTLSPSGPHADLSRTVGLKFEETVGALLQSTGSEIMKPSPRSGPRADFTLYFYGDDSDLGVVLVETKAFRSGSSSSNLRMSARQLSEFVARSSAGLGLLIYDGPPRKDLTAPLVAAMSLDELRNELSTRSLVDVLRRARNEAIHGR